MNVPSWDIPLWQSYPTSANANLRSALVYGTVVPIIIKMQKEMEHADEKASSIAGEVLASIRMIVACGAEGRVATDDAQLVESLGVSVQIAESQDPNPKITTPEDLAWAERWLAEKEA